MNILVTGANGQLGTEIRNASAGNAHRFIFTDVSQVPGVETVYLDITNIDAVRIICASEDIDVIVNCAAYTDVEKAEGDIGFADLLNHTAAANLAAVACERKATLVHISTDYVFDGEGNVPYRETDSPAPLGAYGITKFAGERSIMNSGCNYLIFRTAWLYSPYGKNFVKTMARLTSTNDTVRVVFDQTGTPTYAGDLAEAIFSIIESGAYQGRDGVFHFANEGVCSWYDFAHEIAIRSGHTSCRVLPCHSDEFPSPVKRPAYSVLDKTLFKQTFHQEIPHWTDGLTRCLANLNI
jgi:dTDP-4-dehydrorhamnose reductase